jgi:hypothetical protein
MSKEIVSQMMKATCEGCGASKTWELVGADLNISVLDEMQEWYSVQRKVVGEGGRLIGLSADACSLSCVPAAAIKLALPPQNQEPADDIDMNSLRAANVRLN